MLALEVWKGTHAARGEIVRQGDAVAFVGEIDQGTVCGSGANSEDTATNFQCDEISFLCTNFTCDDSLGDTFGNCGGATEDSYGCKKDYDCDAEVFDCMVYLCGNDGKKDSFNCDSNFDFFCGAIYDCVDTFECSSGHIFDCTSTFDCGAATEQVSDSFTCSSSGDPECDGDFGCVAGYSGNNNNTAGDFVCGIEGKDSDTFNCRITFECSAADDFNCDDSTTFRCGNNGIPEGTPSAGEFSCEGVTFSCATDYKCRNTYCGCIPSSPYTQCCNGVQYNGPPAQGG